jgi:ABC-type multidrug transport system ATPase subunit
MQPVIEAHKLSKRFGTIQAVDNLSFTVYAGDVYGFLGQNGAGKSTTIRMILTLIRPGSGKIRIFGKDLYQCRKEILVQTGAIVEKPDLYGYLSALDNIRIMARLNGGKPGRRELMAKLAKVGLEERASDKVSTFSLGMKQRLGIAIALVHDPALIILDEPANGLDPQGIAEIRKLILQLSREEGKTVFVSSHLLSEVEQIANRILIIDKGRKIAEAEARELMGSRQRIVEIDTTDNRSCLALLAQTRWAGRTTVDSSGRILMQVDVQEIPALSGELAGLPAGLLSFRQKHSLEDLFLSLTNVPNHVETGQH